MTAEPQTPEQKSARLREQWAAFDPGTQFALKAAAEIHLDGAYHFSSGKWILRMVPGDDGVLRKMTIPEVIEAMQKQHGRLPEPEVAIAHVERIAIRRHDRVHLVTVGLVPWSLAGPGLTSGFVPEKIAGDLDFIAVHLYPEKDKVKEAMKTLSGFAVGKPVVIEEMSPLNGSFPEFERFLDESKKTASGWLGFYWGKTLEEYRKSNTIQDALMVRWLELFQKRAPGPIPDTRSSDPHGKG
jgi:hypothetical protein